MARRLGAHPVLITIVVALTLPALWPAASANHLQAEWECPADMRHRDHLILGGLGEFILGIGPGAMLCHFDMGCPTPAPCQFEVTATGSGTGIVEIQLEPLNGINEITSCGPSPMTCTVTAIVDSNAAHESHLNCKFVEGTNAIDVDFECTSRLVQ